MKAKPYVFCPACGEKLMSVYARGSSYRPQFNRFQCAKCHARFRVPGWCNVLQVISFLPTAMLGYHLAKWLGMRSEGLYLLEMVLLMIAGSDGLGILFAYKVPFEMMDAQSVSDPFCTPTIVPRPQKRGRIEKGKLPGRIWLYAVLVLLCLVELIVSWALPS